MMLAKYRTSIIGLGVFLILACIFWLWKGEQWNIATTLSETWDSIFQGKKQFVEIIDIEEERYIPLEEEARVIDSKKNTTVSGSVPMAEKLNLKIEEVIYDVDGADEGRERIVIYNEDNARVDISNLSLQYLKTGAGYGSIAKKNFEAGHHITSNGRFVVGANCTKGTPCTGVDMSWSQALGNDGGTLYLVADQKLIKNENDPEILTAFHY